MSSTRRGVFVTGTDTGVGKTIAATALIRALVREGIRVAAMKPVAAGAALTADGLRNDDALTLSSAANVAVPYELLNPYCLVTPASPHIAAREAGISIDPAFIGRQFDDLASRADFVVVEGAGGWLAPISDSQTMADIATELALPILLVVGVRLGCLNHALLTARAIAECGLAPGGWIANQIDPGFSQHGANIAALELRLGSAPLALIPFDRFAWPQLTSAAARRVLDAAKPLS